MKKNPKIMYFAISLAALTVVAYIWRFHQLDIVAETNKWADFGNYMTGLLGPFFGLITIYLLVEQLQSAEASAADAKHLQHRQQIVMQRQSIEQTFFAWLHSYRDLVSTISVTATQLVKGEDIFKTSQVLNKISGREALTYLWNEHLSDGGVYHRTKYSAVRDAITDFDKNTAPSKHAEQLCIDEMFRIFRELIFQESHNLDSMFSTLFQLMHWIDGSKELDIIQKHQYIAILRSQVSTIELKFLLYYSMTEDGGGIRNLINKYGFIGNARIFDALLALLRANPVAKVLTEYAFDPVAARDKDIRNELARSTEP